jgi:hypothetical protein
MVKSKDRDLATRSDQLRILPPEEAKGTQFVDWLITSSIIPAYTKYEVTLCNH